MSKSHTLLTLVLCCALLVGCAGGPKTTTALATDTPAPAATKAVADQDTATPAGETPIATATTSTEPIAADTAMPTTQAGETPAATATPGQPPTEETAVPVATSEYTGGRLGYADEYITFPEVAEQAAALGYDPARIFGFVRDEVAFEGYQGILRGALGTLWGRAGNAADQAVLLYALLRESGVEARFARGTLGQADAQILLQTMFTPALELSLTDVEPSGTIADPLNDPVLLAETTEHLWVQMFTANGWVDVDPAFPGAEMGHRYAELTAAFSQPPDELYHRLSIRVRLERITPDGFKLAYPLEYEGRVADVVGQRVEFRHALEQMGSQQGMEAVEIGRVIAAQQRRYHPVLRLGETGIIGELFTEAEGLDLDAPVGRIAEALGNEGEEAGPLSGEWLEFTLTFPDGSQAAFERAVFDRLGPSARAASDMDRLMRLDITDLLLTTHLSILIAPCHMPTDVAQSQIAAALQPLMNQHENFQQYLDALRAEGIESETRRFVLGSLLPYDARLWVELSHLTNVMMASAADDAMDEAASLLAVKHYYDSPRVLITSLTDLDDTGTGFSLDLRRDSIRALAHPGVDRAAELGFRMMRGMFEANLEGYVLEVVTGLPAITAPVVFTEAEGQGIGLVALTPADRALLDGLVLTKDVKAHIAQALDAGFSVVVPERFVTLTAAGGEPRVAWWRADTKTGELVGVLDSGLHQGMTFWDSVVLNMYLGQLTGAHNVSTEPIDALVGFDQTLINFAGNVLGALDATTPWDQMYKQALGATHGQIRQAMLELTAAGAHTSAAMYTAGAALAVALLGKLPH